MWRALLVYHLATLALAQDQNVCLGHSTFRAPAISDVDVTCGTQRMELQLLMCPFFFSGYNETLMSLNAEHAKDECKGTPDWTVDPPVLKFNFSITEGAIAACSNKLKVTQEVGTGVFAQFSNIQFVNISGMVISQNPYPGTISYRKELIYKFSCCYPLQYLVNTTHMAVSAVSLAVKEKNGSFISTLSLLLYSDNSYTSVLRIPDGGLELKTRIFVEVRATNLTNRFNVFLDRCYATTTPFPVNSFYYDLFIGCDRDGQTVIGVNGQQQEARFSFEAFRFVQEENRTLSTFYLHCATRLCERSFCSSLSQNCSTNLNSRRRRSADNMQDTTVTDVATVSSGPIITHRDNGGPEGSEAAQQTHMNGTMLGVTVVAGVVGVLCISLLAFITYQMYSSSSFSNTALYQQH